MGLTIFPQSSGKPLFAINLNQLVLEKPEPHLVAGVLCVSGLVNHLGVTLRDRAFQWGGFLVEPLRLVKRKLPTLMDIIV